MRKEAKMGRKMKAYESLKLWFLLFGLHSFTHEFIDPHINNILLITWGQTMGEEMLKFPIIGLKVFWPQFLV